MQYAQMICASSNNIGDDIQAIAAAQHLPKVDLQLDRERLDNPREQAICMIMNAWFMHSNNWPPAEFLRPIFVGFHVTSASKALIARHAEWLKRFEPIGTRDKGTAEFLSSLGIQTEVTYCLTLTFQTRPKRPANGKVILVDVGDVKIPRSLRKNAIKITQVASGLSDVTKIQYARDLLNFYRENAGLIITQRLHCALPCIAMGIPVVFFGDPTSTRTAIVRDIGGTIHSRSLHSFGLGRLSFNSVLQNIDWSPPPLNVESVKANLSAAVSRRLEMLTNDI